MYLVLGSEIFGGFSVFVFLYHEIVVSVFLQYDDLFIKIDASPGIQGGISLLFVVEHIRVPVC